MGSLAMLVANQVAMIQGPDLPHALEVHRPDLHDMANLLALEDAVTAAPSHPGDVQ